MGRRRAHMDDSDHGKRVVEPVLSMGADRDRAKLGSWIKVRRARLDLRRDLHVHRPARAYNLDQSVNTEVVFLLDAMKEASRGLDKRSDEIDSDLSGYGGVGILDHKGCW